MRNSPDPFETALQTANHLHHSALRLFRLLRMTRKAKGLTLSRVAILGRLHREGVAPASELAAYLRVKPQSLTRLVVDLEHRKLIVRRSKNEDRRLIPLEITEAGVRLLNEDIRDQRVRLAQIIAKELTPAEQELLRVAAGLMDQIAEQAESQSHSPVSRKVKT